MRRISAIFIAVCVMLIAASVGAVLYLGFNVARQHVGNCRVGSSYRHGSVQHGQQSPA